VLQRWGDFNVSLLTPEVLLNREPLDMARKRVSTTGESSTGRNEQFRDNYNGKEMTRKEFVREIKQENPAYENYHVRKINGVDTPVSNPDQSTNNNLE
jgi:hypothetical protein